MIQLYLDEAWRPLVPIATFRATHGLPASFGVAHFEPKDYAGLGAIDAAGGALNTLRETILQAVPQTLALDQLMPFFDALREQFRLALYDLNAVVGLREAEIDFAVAGFNDVNQALLYALIQARATRGTPPDFAVIYDTWLNSTVRLSQKQHLHRQGAAAWRVQLINHAYGRVGLRVAMPDAVHYLHDTTYACPAEGYMRQLLGALAARVMARLQS